MPGQFELEPRQDRRASAARSQVYRILSGLFAYPADVSQHDFVLREASEALREAAAELPFGVPAIASLCAQPETADLAAAYTGLFDNCGGRPALSLHEKDYSRADTKQIWEELIRFYEHFGLCYDLKENREWPDHIGVQLEFLHYLTFLEVASPDEAVATYAAAEGDFLERHLAKWAPQLAKKLADKANDSPYGAFADVLAEFIHAEMEFSRQRRSLQ